MPVSGATKRRTKVDTSTKSNEYSRGAADSSAVSPRENGNLEPPVLCGDCDGGWPDAIKARADENGICICTVDELPTWHFQHRRIRYGYRYCQSFASAVYSFGYWHNESINTWSHVIAPIVIAYYFLRQWPSIVEADHGGNTFDRWLLFFTIIMGNVVPLFCSAICHSFYCINKKVHKICWFVDFLGIISGMLFSGFSFLYFTYYCHHTMVYYWSLFIICLCAVLITYVWFKLSKRLSAKNLIPCDRFPEFSFSLCFFITFASFIPLFGAWYLFWNPAIYPEVSYLLAEATGADILVSIGVFVFAQGGVPERFLSHSKKYVHACDMIGHSHQIWHIITATVMLLLTRNAIAFYFARATHVCVF